MRNFLSFSLSLIFFFSACNAPGQLQATPAQTVFPDTEAAVPATDTPIQEYADTECGFVWARQPLKELSRDFEKVLKEEVQPQASGYTEAYGENCINNQGEVVRFLAMETDFHVTVKVKDLSDKQSIGEMIEQVLDVLSQFPIEETPGPQPGYVGITFQAPGDELRLWFRQTDAEAARDNGLRGEELLDALQGN